MLQSLIIMFLSVHSQIAVSITVIMLYICIYVHVLNRQFILIKWP